MAGSGLRYAFHVTQSATSAAADPIVPLPADDSELFELDLRGLRARWADAAYRPAISAEQMTGADLKAQKLGVPGQRLM